MTTFWIILAVVAFLAGVEALFWLATRRKRQGAVHDRACKNFLPQREHLEAAFLQSARLTGKPRGLYWKGIDWNDAIVFVRERNTQTLHALVPVVIHFEAIEGGDMEGVEAVGLPRAATAVFYFSKGRWKTGGRVLFNLNPSEALERFHKQFELVEA